MSMIKQLPSDSPSPGFVPVCAIGASAGGVGALQTLFRLLPDDLGLAYVVVVHLSPDHPSAMHEILGACTRMPVHQVKDGPALQPNCVYVIAPDSELVIDGDNVKSRPFTDLQSRRAPIDMFFRSIAAGRGDGIAVVLTGGGSDGALGVRAIKEGGGIVMVQEPSEAGFPSMPQSAIATGVADVVAPLARLAERIADAAHSKEAVRSLDEDGSANDIRRIVALLRTRTGHDFSGYKRSTVLRRIQRRMQVCQIVELDGYFRYLRAKPDEAKELLSDLLISVTMFFRDPETYVTLTHRVIHPLLESRGTGDAEDELRAWVVGCATGEEAYSLAILLLEEAERLKVNIPIQIFATDLDEAALTTAREGRFPRSIEADVSTERLKRFFIDEGTHYRIDRRVRDLILFASHSVVREPPFMRLDLITCRNVLIYLERSLQQHVNAIFRYGLKDDGYLFLGTAETADTSENHFAVVDRDARIYRALPARPEYVPTLSPPGPWNSSRPALTESRLSTARLDAGEVLGESHAAALELSAPPSALVDAGHSVLHLSPSAGRFILLSAGPLSGRLPSIVRPELRLDLKLALDRAFETQQPMITRPIDVVMDGGSRRVSLHVAPLPTVEGASRRAMVYFLDTGPSSADSTNEHAPPPDELQHLHSELKAAQEAELAGRLRHESVVQELRASNEELQSLNEEYRSTAEELETSKEELQSINEELQTVNAELKSKLGIISAAHNDLQNLTASSEIGTLFLDLDLRIRMFTPRVAELINVAEADVGRPITNFTHRMQYDDIATDVRRVLRDLTPSEAEVRTVEGRWFLVRIRPYRTIEGRVEGAVATFDDITERKEAVDALADELRNTEILQKLGARLVTEDNIPTIYEDILAAAIEISRAKAGTVQMLDPNVPELIVLATRGFSRRTEEYFHRVDASSNTACGLALRNGGRSYCNFDPDSSDISVRMHVEDGVLSAQSSILTTRSGRSIGMVSTHWADLDHRPSHRELQFLNLLVRQAADFLEQRTAEAALRESEQRRDLAMAAAGMGTWDFDLIANVCHFDTRAQDMYNLPSDTLDYRPEGVSSVVHPDDVGPMFDVLRHASDVQGDGRYDIDYRIRQKDGSYRWLRAWGQAEFAGEGTDRRAVRIVGSSRDITDEKDAQSRLAADLAAARELQAVSTELVSDKAPEALFERILDAAMKLMNADAASVQIFEADSRRLSLLASRNFHPESRSYWQWVDASSHSSYGQALNTQTRVIIQNIRDLAALDRSEDQAAFRQSGLSALQSTPLISRDGRRLGMISTHWRKPHLPVPSDFDLFDVLARQAADLIDRSQAEMALRESEARLRDREADLARVQRVGDVGGLDIDIASGTSRRSPEYLRLHGLTLDRSDESHADWLARVHPDDAAQAERLFRMALEGNASSYEGEYRIIRQSDGAVRWIAARADIERDADGQAVRLVGAHIDVTEQKRAQDALRESERRLQTLVEGVPHLVWRAVDDGHWTWASPQWTDYTGQAEVDSHAWGWLMPVHPDDRDGVRKIWDGARERGEFHADYRISHISEGRYRWFQTRATPVRDEDGAIVEWLGTSTDVDDLRQLQKRQEVLVAELQHRTFNLLGMVRSTADATINSSISLDQFKTKFRDRIAALARVQRLLSRVTDDDRVSFDELIKGELEAVGALQDERVVLEGPDGIPLRSSTVQTFAMALHELTTMAVKYGALKHPNARLAVRWKVQDGEGDRPWLHLNWHESDVPLSLAEHRSNGTGQGRALIEEALPYQLRAVTSYTFTQDGIRCSIALPVSARTIYSNKNDPS